MSPDMVLGMNPVTTPGMTPGMKPGRIPVGFTCMGRPEITRESQNASNSLVLHCSENQNGEAAEQEWTQTQQKGLLSFRY